MSKVLLVAFDGMDRELMEEYRCEFLLNMDEVGDIDNSSDTFRIWTTELFTSLITGVNYDEHGVRALSQWDNEKLDDLEKVLERNWFFRKFNGLRKNFWEFLGFENIGYSRNDYPQDTLFEKIEDSKSIDVPGYDVLLNKGGDRISTYGIQGAVKHQDWIHEKKKEDLFNAIGEEHDFLMAHFHKLDHYHHWFWEMGEEEPVKEVYEEFDRFAEEIYDRAKDRYDYIVFMSDHGLPTKHQHNENAFYGTNKEFFGEKTPKITDFHDRIIDIVGKSGKISNESQESSLSEEQEEQVKENLKNMGYI
ncbi:MAG: alkaline phosphatase family protein [Candidatus Nanohaloarchaea archaeon]